MDEQFKQYKDRVRLYKRYGFDIELSKKFILKKSELGDESILEIGTGRGYMAVTLLKKGKKFVSIDIDREAQKNAGLCFKQMDIDKNISEKIMNAENLAYKDEVFDFVISTNTVHHFENPGKCLKEIVRVAKKKIVISDFNKTGARLIDRIHMAEGKDGHHMGGMDIREVKIFLEKLRIKVKAYSYMGETTLVGEKKHLT